VQHLAQLGQEGEPGGESRANRLQRKPAVPFQEAEPLQHDEYADFIGVSGASMIRFVKSCALRCAGASDFVLVIPLCRFLS
jgi:hypothetical protein